MKLNNCKRIQIAITIIVFLLILSYFYVFLYMCTIIVLCASKITIIVYSDLGYNFSSNIIWIFFLGLYPVRLSVLFSASMGPLKLTIIHRFSLSVEYVSEYYLTVKLFCQRQSQLVSDSNMGPWLFVLGPVLGPVQLAQNYPNFGF